MLAHGNGGQADHGNRLEQHAMRHAEMLAPPADLPGFGEIDRERRESGRRSCVPASFGGDCGPFHCMLPCLAGPDPGRSESPEGAGQGICASERPMPRIADARCRKLPIRVAQRPVAQARAPDRATRLRCKSTKGVFLIQPRRHASGDSRFHASTRPHGASRRDVSRRRGNTTSRERLVAERTLRVPRPSIS